MIIQNYTIKDFIYGDYKNASIAYYEINIALIKSDQYFEKEFNNWKIILNNI